jgi:Mg2+/Co2+ transporter CorB
VDEAYIWLLVVFLICLVLSAFFSSAESAFISLPKLRIRYLVESGVKGAKQLAKAAEKPERFLATVLLGNNLVNVAAATLGTIMAVSAFGVIRGPIIATLGVTAVILVFGEVVPKTLAVHHAQRLSLAYIKPLRVIEWCRVRSIGSW